ncbi:hypothetical protein QBC33DRAFT_244579 [Phialemonium atrogriseum]|uniref:Uncharacterized protein n=1 Tax=Phialemonium atrogriseum TaxID=1093897 RepID=A0AAJ0BUQ0_9PEZI|nr:uncharacterized protein QBC33DRAFT_244579 [Phialemonium atrogriseum]KAK1763444.1 hypothetical protein QBC33DRAFT_244579 [Phialemonium atrogriseum]
MPARSVGPGARDASRHASRQGRPPDVTQSASPPTGPLIWLDDSHQLERWTHQTELLAKRLGCSDELLGGASMPTDLIPRTFTEYMLKHRIDTAMAIITTTIRSAVYAYARVLGYSEICGRSPTSLYFFVRKAAARRHIAAEGNLADEEAARVLSEWQIAKPEFYPTTVRFEGAMLWLESIIRKCHERGNKNMAHAVSIMDRLAERKTQERRKRAAPADEDNNHGAPPTPATSATHTSAAPSIDGASMSPVENSPVEGSSVEGSSDRPSAKRQMTDELVRIRAGLKSEPESPPAP